MPNRAPPSTTLPWCPGTHCCRNTATSLTGRGVPEEECLAGGHMGSLRGGKEKYIELWMQLSHTYK